LFGLPSSSSSSLDQVGLDVPTLLGAEGWVGRDEGFRVLPEGLRALGSTLDARDAITVPWEVVVARPRKILALLPTSVDAEDKNDVIPKDLDCLHDPHPNLDREDEEVVVLRVKWVGTVGIEVATGGEGEEPELEQGHTNPQMVLKKNNG
jgi:hypothetical protein